MFKYNPKTKVDVNFKMLELFRTIRADKKVKTDAENILTVKLSNTLSPAKTNMEASENVQEIYVIDIELNSKQVPELFIDAFNKYIAFQKLFRLRYKEEIKYITSIKTFEDEKTKILKMFESDWGKVEVNDFPITNRLEIVFKNMLKFITGYSFTQVENFEEYVSRLDGIKKLKTEIEKLTKTMNAEKQPNIRMSINDKIKLLKKELISKEI